MWSFYRCEQKSVNAKERLSTSRRINRYVNNPTAENENGSKTSSEGNHVIEELQGEEARARYLGEAVT